MAKLFYPVKKIVRLGREKELTTKSYYQIVATQPADFQIAKFVVEPEPPPRFVFYPDPNEIYFHLTTDGSYHIFFRTIIGNAPKFLRRHIAVFLENPNYRAYLETQAKINPAMAERLGHIKGSVYATIHREIIRGRRLIGLFGKPDWSVLIALGQGLIVKNIVADISLTPKKFKGKEFEAIKREIGTKEFEEFIEFKYADLIKRIKIKTTMEDFSKIYANIKTELQKYRISLTTVNIKLARYQLAQPQEIITPSAKEIKNRLDDLARKRNIAGVFSKVAEKGLPELTKLVTKQIMVYEGELLQKGLKPKKIRPETTKKRLAIQSLMLSDYDLHSQFEIWESMNVQFGIRPNPYLFFE